MLKRVELQTVNANNCIFGSILRRILIEIIIIIIILYVRIYSHNVYAHKVYGRQTIMFKTLNARY